MKADQEVVGSGDRVEETEIIKIRDVLDADEKVLLCGKQSRLRPGGSLTTPNTIFITNKRVIIRNPSMLGLRSSIEDYLYKNITGVKVQKGLFSSMIYLTVPGRTEASRIRGNRGKSLLRWGRRDEAELAAFPNKEAQKAMSIIKDGIAGRLEQQREQNIHETPEDDPLKILKIRYAKGEITKKEFDKMKKALE